MKYKKRDLWNVWKRKISERNKFFRRERKNKKWPWLKPQTQLSINFLFKQNRRGFISVYRINKRNGYNFRAYRYLYLHLYFWIDNTWNSSSQSIKWIKLVQTASSCNLFHTRQTFHLVKGCTVWPWRVIRVSTLLFWSSTGVSRMQHVGGCHLEASC